MPLTSIQCWHVHCEECWLRTLVRAHTFAHTVSPNKVYVCENHTFNQPFFIQLISYSHQTFFKAVENVNNTLALLA